MTITNNFYLQTETQTTVRRIGLDITYAIQNDMCWSGSKAYIHARTNMVVYMYIFTKLI